jgi:hypothetical protein
MRRKLLIFGAGNFKEKLHRYQPIIEELFFNEKTTNRAPPSNQMSL